ncbi:MAG: Cys-tRNA(Pro) deacylase [Spirulina sp. SIO3F2]|nr:Cys-tRNA(Pro) deacylase [Spirulina sp. SIO3F2]
MTPAITAAKKAQIAFTVHEYDHDPAHQSYGLEAAEKLGIASERIFKTLVAQLESSELVVAIVPVSAALDLKQLAKAVGAKKARMANPQVVERTTGYVLGGVSPLGQRKALKTVIDHSATQHQTIYVSAGRRGLEIELAVADLHVLTAGRLAAIAKAKN